MTDPSEVGTIIASKYRVERVLCVGAIATVVQATRLDDQSLVAIKYLPSKSISNPETVGRFQNEANTLKELSGDHIVKIFDVGKMDSGEPFLVMEYLEGETLADYLAGNKKLALPEAFDMAGQISVALACCHGKGVVHRDLNPRNIFLVKDDKQSVHVKLIDFGLVKISGAFAAMKGLTAEEAKLGTPQHMSPEQLRSASKVDHRTDIWALGSVLYTMLAGHAPFRGDTLSMLCTQITRAPAPSIRTEREVIESIDLLIQRCLEKERDARIQSVADLMAQLGPHYPRGAEHEEQVRKLLGLKTELAPTATTGNNRIIVAVSVIITIVMVIILIIKQR